MPVVLIPEIGAIKPPKTKTPAWLVRLRETSTRFTLFGPDRAVFYRQVEGQLRVCVADDTGTWAPILLTDERIQFQDLDPIRNTALLRVGEFSVDALWEIDLTTHAARQLLADPGLSARYLGDRTMFVIGPPIHRMQASVCAIPDEGHATIVASAPVSGIIHGLYQDRTLAICGAPSTPKATVLSVHPGGLTVEGVLQSGEYEGFTQFKACFEVDDRVYVRATKKMNGHPSSLFTLTIGEAAPAEPAPEPLGRADVVAEWQEAAGASPASAALSALLGRALPPFFQEAYRGVPHDYTVFAPDGEQLLAADNAFADVVARGETAVQQVLLDLWFLDDDGGGGDGFLMALPDSLRREARVVHWLHNEGFGPLAAVDVPTWAWVKRSLGRSDRDRRLQAVHEEYGRSWFTSNERAASALAKHAGAMGRLNADFSASCDLAKGIAAALVEPTAARARASYATRRLQLPRRPPRHWLGGAALRTLWHRVLTRDPEAAETLRLAATSESKLVADAADFARDRFQI